MYARTGKFKEALEVWSKKLPLVESEMEKTWLFHEIGKKLYVLTKSYALNFTLLVIYIYYLGHCHLESNDYNSAKVWGMKALECAEKINNELWKLNSFVLNICSTAWIVFKSSF